MAAEGGKPLALSMDYDEGGMELVVPARVPEETIARIQQLAVESFVATDCEGLARVDFFVREDGEVIVNEVTARGEPRP